MGQKIKLQTFVQIFTKILMDFHFTHFIFHKTQGSVATQLRCGGMFSNHFTSNFSQNTPVKKILKIGQYLAKIWTKLCGLLFWGHPVFVSCN